MSKELSEDNGVLRFVTRQTKKEQKYDEAVELLRRVLHGEPYDVDKAIQSLILITLPSISDE